MADFEDVKKAIVGYAVDKAFKKAIDIGNEATYTTAEIALGVPAEDIKKYIYPYLTNGEDPVIFAAILVQLARKGQLEDFFLYKLSKAVNTPNAGAIIDDFYKALTDENGQIRDSVKNSAVFSLLIEGIRRDIPDEIKKAIPENQMVDFIRNTLKRVVSTKKGRQALASSIKQLSSNADSKVKDQKTGLDEIMAKEALVELLSKENSSQLYKNFHKQIFTQDSQKGYVLRKDLSQPIQEIINNFQTIMPSFVSQSSTNEQLVLCSSVIQKFLEDPERRKAFLKYIENPKENWGMYKAIKGAIHETLEDPANKEQIYNMLRVNLDSNYNNVNEKTGKQNPQQVYQFSDPRIAEKVAKHLTNILIHEPRLVTGFFNMDSEGKIDTDSPRALKDVRNCILSVLDSNLGDGRAYGKCAEDIKAILNIYFHQNNSLQLSEKSIEMLTKALTKSAAVELLRAIIPSDFTKENFGNRLQENLLYAFKNTRARFNSYNTYENNLMQVFDSDLRCQLVPEILTSQVGISPVYAKSLSQFISDNNRFESILNIIGEAKIEDGKLQNAEKVLTKFAEKFDNKYDRRAMASALSPSLRAYFGIKENEEKETKKSSAPETKLAPVSPLAIVAVHFLTHKNYNDFMDKPIEGATGEIYKNLSEYLASDEVRSEMSRLKGNKTFKKLLTKTEAVQWNALLGGIIPDEKTFKAFQLALLTDPSKAFATSENYGLLPPQDKLTAIIKNAYDQEKQEQEPEPENLLEGLFRVGKKMAKKTVKEFSLFMDGLSIVQAMGRNEDLIVTYPDVLMNQPEIVGEVMAQQKDSSTEKTIQSPKKIGDQTEEEKAKPTAKVEEKTAKRISSTSVKKTKKENSGMMATLTKMTLQQKQVKTKGLSPVVQNQKLSVPSVNQRKKSLGIAAYSTKSQDNVLAHFSTGRYKTM